MSDVIIGIIIFSSARLETNILSESLWLKEVGIWEAGESNEMKFDPYWRPFIFKLSLVSHLTLWN